MGSSSAIPPRKAAPTYGAAARAQAASDCPLRLAAAYDFADAFVLDEADGTDLDRPVVRTDTAIDDAGDAARVARAVRDALEVAS